MESTTCLDYNLPGRTMLICKAHRQTGRTICTRNASSAALRKVVAPWSRRFNPNELSRAKDLPPLYYANDIVARRTGVAGTKSRVGILALQPTSQTFLLLCTSHVHNMVCIKARCPDLVERAVHHNVHDKISPRHRFEGRVD